MLSIPSLIRGWSISICRVIYSLRCWLETFQTLDLLLYWTYNARLLLCLFYFYYFRSMCWVEVNHRVFLLLEKLTESFGSVHGLSRRVCKSVAKYTWGQTTLWVCRHDRFIRHCLIHNLRMLIIFNWYCLGHSISLQTITRYK